MSKPFNDFIGSIDILTEESKTAIAEAFESTVNQKVEERLQLEVTKALTDLDAKHAEQLTKVLEAVDTDHAKKFAQALKQQDEDHTKKLQAVVEKYEAALKKDAESLKESLTEDISNFLDLYIEKMIPTKEISKAVENAQAARLLENIRQIVSIDERYITENVKEALVDGKQKIDSLHAKLNQTLKENIDLKKSVKNLESKIVLSEKTADFPRAKKQFVSKLLENKSPEYIKENFDYVVEMFEKEDDGRQVVTEQRKVRRRNVIAESVDTPEVQTELPAPSNTPTNEYLTALKAFDK